MIDTNGFRPNVGIILTNHRGQVLWARRIKQKTWQFPQGGIDHAEIPEEAMYRELYEEIGLQPSDIKILACTHGWLRYLFPKRLIRKDQYPVCIGQKQKWFLLELLSGDDQINMDCTVLPEFDEWRWVSYWYPLGQIVPFKRKVYRKALHELSTKIGRLQINHYIS